MFPLSEVQRLTDPDLITQGWLCLDKRYFVSTPGLWKHPQVTVGEAIYQTRLSEGLGGLRFLEVLPDGSFYLLRSDVMPITPIKVDQTIHYVDRNGVVQGMARIPSSEFFYPPNRNAAIGPDGEVYVLLPRRDSIDIVRLIFYKELEALIPGAVIPHIERQNPQYREMNPRISISLVEHRLYNSRDDLLHSSMKDEVSAHVDVGRRVVDEDEVRPVLDGAHRQACHRQDLQR